MARKMKTNTKFFVVFLIVLFSCTNSHIPKKCDLPELKKESFLHIKTLASFRTCGESSCEEIPSGASVASGFIVSNVGNDSIGLTAGHVCETMPPPPLLNVEVVQKIKVYLWGGAVFDAQIEHIIKEVDMCILRIKNVRIPPLKLATKAPEHGDEAYTMAAPYGIFDPELLLVFHGTYSGVALNVPISDSKQVFKALDAYTIPTRSGSSGSPILNNKGEVIGMTIMSMRSLENMCLSPTFNNIKSVLTSYLGETRARHYMPNSKSYIIYKY